ncbi:unnamed protein product [Lathyrus oleraceus]|uniref:Uncharacterized protein n=1 Tax=Pisum sativum TaxID=3888 RepID=A0A9D4WQD7_PEA|nr:uncharacterized protein LOC127082842 [Pisum sativum]KAI5405957.1 hypothetical protein KIW84_052638 [Pisum sativum]
MNRNGYKDEKSCCYFHPKQLVVGVCPLCLNERLLLLVAKQGRRHHQNHRSSSKKGANSQKPPNSSSIHKIFAFGSLFTRLESRQCKSHSNNRYEYDDLSPSPEEEAFISIKFEENGVGSWEKSSVSKVTLENCNNNKLETKSVIEHGKSRDIFRWRKRIGHMFQLIRWKKSAGVCHVSNKVEGGTVKVRKSWIKTLTKRRKNKTME